MADVRNNDRKDRLSAALRENLKRRKQQLRGRAGEAGTGHEQGTGHAHAGTAVEVTGSTDGDDRAQGR
jgi:hypothetical protein